VAKATITGDVNARPTIPGTIAVVQLQPLVVHLPELGVDLSRVLARAGLTADQLRDASARLPCGVEFAFWDAVEEITGDPLIGLRVAERCGVGELGGFGYLLRNMSTAREAIQQANRFERVLDDLTRVSLIENGEESYLRLWREGGYRHPPRGVECVFSVLLRVSRAALPGHEPIGVHFSHPAPGDLRECERFLRCAVAFEQPYDQIVFATDALDLPVLAADPQLALVLEQHMQRLLDTLPTEDPFVHRARGTLLQALQSGSASLEGLAAALHLSPRTLRRRLEEHGTSYKNLLDELRRELAYYYIGRTDDPPDTVASRLGFTEPSTFYRAFKRWSGTTPALYRAQLR
jgi:AraC-like DNA-binding protein